MNRKRILRLGAGAIVLAIPVLIYSCSVAINQIGGASSKAPKDMRRGLSQGARQLVLRAFEGIERSRMVDYHTHLVGLGAGGTGALTNERMHSWMHPLQRIKFFLYMSASGVENTQNADQEYLARLVDLIENIDLHGKYSLLAFDKHYESDGSANLEETEFYTPNEYLMKVTGEFPGLFIPVISVHPYRSDAVLKLQKWADRGVRFVKWLPNAMGMDPSEQGIEPFYEKMQQLDMVLISHAGEEKAVDAEEAQKLGNPLLLRKPLDMGVKVIVAHCASLGQNEDLDDPTRPMVDNFDLFLRLMGEEKYKGLLFGDISATTQTNRLWKPLTELLEREDLHGRLVNGSDYPLPAFNILIRTDEFMRAGFITREERRYLNEIYDYNPLLFDFVLKRTIALPDSGKRFPASVFMAHPTLEKK